MSFLKHFLGKVEEVSEKLGVALNMVYPVQNYSVETAKDRGIEILTLRTLRQIIRCSETFLEDFKEREDAERNQAAAALSRLDIGNLSLKVEHAQLTNTWDFIKSLSSPTNRNKKMKLD